MCGDSVQFIDTGGEYPYRAGCLSFIPDMQAIEVPLGLHIFSVAY
jgi:hypothetical protein